MANRKPKTTKSTVTTTSTGNPLYHIGATGRDVDTVGKYLVDNGYMSSYSGKYDSNMKSALQSAKKDLLGGSDYKGATFGAATLNAIANKNAEAAAAAKEEAYNNGYNYAMGNVESVVQSALAPYQQMYANMQAQQNAALQNANRLNQDQINSAYDNSAREYYRLYKTQQKQLPETLSRLGVTGGASESSQLKLLNSYSDNLYKNESARNNQLAGINADYNNQIAENSINAANQMANAYLQMAQQQLAYKRQDELVAKEQQAQAEENAAAQTVAQWNANVRARMEEQLAKGDTIWTWTDESGKIHWTTYESRGLAMGGKKLSPSSSKVGTTSRIASTYSSGGGGSSGGGSSSSKGASYADVLGQAKLRLAATTRGNNRATNLTTGPIAAVEYIESSGLTEAQKNKAYKELGLA